MVSPITKLIYVGDPMCSWCWGFGPEIESLRAEHPVQVVVGGLRPGPMAEELDDRLAKSLRHHWIEVGEQTGQPFDLAFLDRRDGWLYDTEPAAIAVAEFRHRDPEHALDYFTRVQHSFYAEAQDVTDFSVLAGLASELAVDAADFEESLTTEEAKERAWRDFARARAWGIAGFPALLGELLDGRLALLARGWGEAGVIRGRISSLDEALAG